MNSGERFSRVDGPLKRAGVDGREWERSQPVGKCLGLLSALMIQVDARQMTCQTISHIICLTVPDEDQNRHNLIVLLIFHGFRLCLSPASKPIRDSGFESLVRRIVKHFSLNIVG